MLAPNAVSKPSYGHFILLQAGWMMSDIFISYASADREQARTLAQTLEAQGWSVWWDHQILPGKTFDQVIEEAIDASRCVVVLWSGSSVTSDWVKTEADEGRQRGILVPVLIEDVKIPLEFRRIQAARLVNWSGEIAQPEFKVLKQAIETVFGAPPVRRIPREARKPPSAAPRRPAAAVGQPASAEVASDRSSMTKPDAKPGDKPESTLSLIGGLAGGIFSLILIVAATQSYGGFFFWMMLVLSVFAAILLVQRLRRRY